MYDSSLDSDNGGWLVLGNPIVLSSSSANESYTIYADGWISQREILTQGNNAAITVIFKFPFSDIPYVQAIPHYNGSSAGERRFGYNISTTQFTITAISYITNTQWTEYTAEGY